MPINEDRLQVAEKSYCFTDWHRLLEIDGMVAEDLGDLYLG